METSFLNKTFDYTQELISKNPENEDKIIADYINFIIKVKNNNKPFVRSATYTDSDPTMPSTIRIQNNFQKYNPGSSEDPIFIPTSPMSNDNSSFFRSPNNPTPTLRIIPENSEATPTPIPINPNPTINPPTTTPSTPANPANPAPTTPANPPTTTTPNKPATFRNMEGFKGYYR